MFGAFFVLMLILLFLASPLPAWFILLLPPIALECVLVTAAGSALYAFASVSFSWWKERTEESQGHRDDLDLICPPTDDDLLSGRRR
jgi:hypothetical protein